MHRMLLIARREILAYAAVPSFWVALAMGPILMVLGGLAASSVGHKPPAAVAPRLVVVEAADAGLKNVAVKALSDAAALEGRDLAVLQPHEALPIDATRVALSVEGRGQLKVSTAGATLPAAAEALMRRDLARAAARDLAREAGAPEQALIAGDLARVEVVAPTAAPGADAAPAADARFGRFAVVVLLWMNLVGALGMLLQAVVRERANRALESLLASARASEIIFGKLIGVGGLSLFVLAVWLGAGALVAASPLVGQAGGMTSQILGAFADARSLGVAAAMFVAAFAMYGTALIGLGALARDVPAAQNLSRPVFGVLLLVFFVSLAQLTGGAAGMNWLTWIPLFTPFTTLMADPGSMDLASFVGGLLAMVAVTALCARLASLALRDQPLSQALAWAGRTSRARA